MPPPQNFVFTGNPYHDFNYSKSLSHATEKGFLHDIPKDYT